MLNTIVIQGRFKADLELRHTYSGTAVAAGTLAVQRSRKDTNGEYPTDWIDVVFWGKTAEHASQWFHKGDMAIVRGRLKSRDWEDKNGNKRCSWEVQAESIDFCDGKKEGKQGYAEQNNGYVAPNNGYAAQDSDFADMTDDDGDVPF